MTSGSVWPEQSSDAIEEGSDADKTFLDDTMGLEELMALNITNENELDCLFKFLRESYPPAGFEAVNSFCNRTWDGVSCWPTTLSGTTSILPCVDELNGIKYDTTRKLLFLQRPSSPENEHRSASISSCFHFLLRLRHYTAAHADAFLEAN
jgi:hypothetical protein